MVHMEDFSICRVEIMYCANIKHRVRFDIAWLDQLCKKDICIGHRICIRLPNLFLNSSSLNVQVDLFSLGWH